MTQTPDAALVPIDRLIEIMACLRDPASGCPWDLEQDFKSIAAYTVEEAYEVADAIERGQYDELKDELGDLLLQVVFHARMAQEAGLFDFDGVAAAINDKMIRRHPHVFGDAVERDSVAQTVEWEAQKARERAASPKGDGVLADIPLALPAVKRAQKLQARAARVGFDWPNAEQVFDKIDEEIGEVKAAIRLNDPEEIAEEIGDLMFVCTNLGRKLNVNVEAATRSANAKFERRFNYIERRLAAKGRRPDDASLEEMEALWDEAKQIDKASKNRPA
ncbi:nucleoside triphosphate pyrophosphohydrolase [uncultured Maricaulis sp.]|uniref:nucleoside triphosphate pyrophosphohydrolase n=1 Tax=uncultured Maricaulis sp. TaxID=174710 RepID=UPI0030D93DC4|tara:strand:+ start:119078 stop:119905 length:828 start_codon:yes stop_codon:yes gene_type:complete